MIHFGRTQNVKVGKGVFVSTSSAATCPDTCSFKVKGCYAKYGPLSVHWQKVTEGKRGDTWENFTKAIRGLSKGELWRHNQSGDLQGDNTVIDAKALTDIVEANKGKRGFTYTHKPMTDENLKLVRYANNNGFTINLSADNLKQADDYVKIGGVPVVVVMPADAEKVSYTPAGNKVVVCPAVSAKREVTCKTCQLCQRADRDFVIGFPAHGTAKKTVGIIARG